MNNMRNSNEITSSVTNFCCSDSLMGVQSRRLLLWVQTKTKINSLSRQEVKDTLFALCSDSSMTSRQELPPQEELSDFECQTSNARQRFLLSLTFESFKSLAKVLFSFSSPITSPVFLVFFDSKLHSRSLGLLFFEQAFTRTPPEPSVRSPAVKVDENTRHPSLTRDA